MVYKRVAMTRLASLLVIAAAACGRSPAPSTADAPAAQVPDAPVASPDAAPDAALPGFGELGGECGVLAVADLTGAAPELHLARFTFARAYVDPDDRPLLTAGGQTMMATPNAGGSSGASEAFAYEELARCELASLLKTETEIVYDVKGKITDLEVSIDGHKIGVSVTRAETYPLGQTYTLQTATALLTKKLDDIKVSTADVSAADRWDKQILAVVAYDDQAADTMAQAWSMLDEATRGDTIVIVTSTDGPDTWLY
jgi:hypothetical protein